MATPIVVNGTDLRAGRPVALFHTPAEISATSGQYDIARDGRILINAVLDETVPPITVVLNWRPGMGLVRRP
jgi:hypothetical protein